MAMIEARDLSRRFGETVAVDGLSLKVAEGEVLALLGPNGAGKTTTIRMLAGIIAPSGGYAVVAGLRADSEAERLHQAVGLLTETPGFYDNLSARHNLEFYAGFYDDIDIPAQVAKYLGIMGLGAHGERKVGTFSKGMKQRLALARALLHEPRVLFLDEPTAGLDPEAAREVRDMVRGLSEQGRTIFLSTHNLDEAESLCRRIAIMRTRLLALDTTHNLRQRLFRRQVVVTLAAAPPALVAEIRRLPFVRGLEQAQDRLTLELDDADKNRPELVARIVAVDGQVMAITEVPHSLEEVYLSLVREAHE